MQENLDQQCRVFDWRLQFVNFFPGFPLALFIFAFFTRVSRLARGWVSPFHEWITGVVLMDVPPYDTAACPTLQAEYSQGTSNNRILLSDFFFQ